jgi:hypothetical protein
VSVGAPSAAGYADAISRITQIQSQIAGMQDAFTPAAQSSSSSGGAGLTAAGAATTSGALSGAGTASAVTADAATLGTTTAPTSFASTLSGAMSGVAAGTVSGTVGTTGLPTLPTTGTSVALPANASTMLTSDQQQFASRLASQTGLDPGVVSAWLLAEESGGAAQSRQSANNNDWLNIGYTDSGTFGSGGAQWSNPITAADATAGWLQGKNTIPGYGTASSGIQAIVGTAGLPPADQIAALQGSGWASSGYPALAPLYSQVTGQSA